VPPPESSPSSRAAGTDQWVNTLFDTIYRAYNAQDADATRDCYAPSVQITVNGVLGPGNRETFVEALGEQWAGFPDLTATETNRILIEDRVITEMRIEGHNSAPFLGRPATGKPWQVSLIWICRVDEGQVQEIRVYIDDSALRSAITASS
jgi:predicted ester cyclase